MIPIRQLACLEGQTRELEPALRTAFPDARISAAKSVAELAAIVRDGHPEAILLGLGKPLAEKTEALRHPDLLGRAHLILALAGDDGEARELAALGAGEVLPGGWLWRLPAALAGLVERERFRRERQALEDLLAAAQALSLARGLPQIIDIVRRAARRISGADGASFVLREGDQCHYVDEDAIGPLWKGKRFPMSACISGWVMLNRRAAAVGDIYRDPRIPADAYRPTFVKSLVMAPIRAEAPIGAIGIYWARTREFEEKEVELLRSLADATALAIENVYALDDLERRVRDRTAGLEAANRELEAFTYTVCHDLRSPLQVILTLCGSLEAGPPGAPTDRRVTAAIRESAERIRCLAEDLLRLARVDRGDLEIRPVDLSLLAKSILKSLREQEPAREVECRVEEGLSAQGDPGLLRIALENLLQNAWKYTRDRIGARIEVAVPQDGEGGVESEAPMSRLCVRDNGIGFRMEDAGRLFEPFHRLPSARNFPGTGVGLATVRRILERHGGSVRAESSPGAGAAFQVRLPRSSASVPDSLAGRPPRPAKPFAR